MKYLYYPGCSLEGTAREYHLSTKAVMAALDAELVEIDGWTCCGASAAEATHHLLALALPARNLALAQAMDPKLEVVVPCSACYLNLNKATEAIQKDDQMRALLNQVLAAENLQLKGQVRVRHLLDVLATDVGPAPLQARTAQPLSDWQVAPYYGCQCLRPYSVFDDPEQPRAMEPLLAAVGAGVFRWHMGARCCGAAHMNTKMAVGIELVAAILKDARGADAIVTVCPMCQMNLEAHQSRISRQRGQALNITVLYLPQLLGLALGLPPEALRFDLNLAVTKDMRAKLARHWASSGAKRREAAVALEPRASGNGGLLSAP